MNTVKLNSPYGNLNRFLLLGFVFFFSSSAFSGDLNLAWNASTSTGVGGYKLYYGTSSKSYTSNVDVGNTTTYKMTGLTNGSTYYFALKAYNAAKSIESSYSNEVGATVPTAAAPLSVAFNASAINVVQGASVTFTPTPSGTVTSWNWSLPGSNATTATSTAQVTTVSYPTPGTYTVGLKVTGPSGSANAPTKQITVTPTPPVVVTSPPPRVVPPSTTNNSNGLVASYSFNESTGATVTDASGNGNHGIITEATRTASGYFGNALKFDGVNDWVSVNDSASLDLSSGMTLEAWVNPAVVMNSWRTVLLKEQTGDEVYSLLANTDVNKPIMGQWINGGVKTLSGGSSLAPNKWWHLTATYDGQTQRLYVNGAQVSERAQTGLIQQSNGALRIGGNSIWGEYFQGLIDEVRIYNRALTNAEISKDVQTATSASTPPKLVVGSTTLEPYVDQVSAGRAQAFKTTPSQNVTVTALQVYVDASSTATELVAGIYSDNAGHPGTLLAQGKRVSPQAGATNTVSINATTLTAGKPYWIALLSNAKGQVKFRINGKTSPMEMCATTGLSSLPTQWVPGNAGVDGPMAVYGTGY
jgi:plastocyanin